MKENRIRDFLKTMNKPSTKKQDLVQLKLVKDSEMVPLDLIDLNGSVQSRVRFNDETLQDYAKAWQRGVIFPPVELYFDGHTYSVGDGFHRIASREKAEIKSNKIAAIVHRGTKRDAMLHAVGANDTHGLRRTKEDKRHAVEILLQDEEWSQWSNREIARKACVSEFLVRSVKSSICDLNADRPAEIKVRRNGTVYIQKTENIGKQQKGKPISSSFDVQLNNKEDESILLIKPKISNSSQINRFESSVPTVTAEELGGWEHISAVLIKLLLLFPDEVSNPLFQSCWNKAFC